MITSAAEAVKITHKACSVHATRKRGGFTLILAKRTSVPPAAWMRVNRKLPSRTVHTATIPATMALRGSSGQLAAQAAAITVR